MGIWGEGSRRNPALLSFRMTCPCHARQLPKLLWNAKAPIGTVKARFAPLGVPLDIHCTFLITSVPLWDTILYEPGSSMMGDRKQMCRALFSSQWFFLQMKIKHSLLNNQWSMPGYCLTLVSSTDVLSVVAAGTSDKQQAIESCACAC